MRTLLACVCAVLLSTAASAQTFRGSIAVAVIDAQGGVLPGALVKVTSTGS
jgi:hypothetical protein